MVKWEGWDRCSATPIAGLLAKDERSQPLEVRLEAYEDGRAAPVLRQAQQAAAAPRRGGRAAPGGNDAADDDDDDAVDGDGEAAEADNAAVEVTCHEQVWRKADPTSVRVDARTKPRTKPSLNKGDLSLKTIDQMFYYLMPEDWINIQLKYTNPKLQGTDATNAKLTKGTLIQWWGYSLALSLNPGVPLEKMWSTTPTPESILPPPRMGDRKSVV